MNKNTYFIILLLSILSCNSDDVITDPMTEGTGFEGYTLEWADEFNQGDIDDLNWVHELGDGTAYGLPSGWGNNEIQEYTDADENSKIEMDGDVSALMISVTEDSPENYLSAKLTTQNLQSFRYGKIDARIKLPTAQGMWPAFWTLGDNRPDIDWPGCGEIDILELVGNQPNTVHANVHYTGADNKYENDEGSPITLDETFDLNYHDFGIEWTPTEIIFSLDGDVYKTTVITEHMKEFQRSFYLILNIAVGGPWAGNPDETTTFPQNMYVDYIRYYSKDDFAADAPPLLVVEEETVGNFVDQNIAQLAFNSTLNQFSGLELKIHGAGGEPLISASDSAIEGDSSLLFSYPGVNWGGGWFEMDTPQDLSSYASGNIVFSIQQSGSMNDAEFKLEAVSNSAAVFLVNYTPTQLQNGFVEYIIPISDFMDLDLTEIKIPFALWNVVDDSGSFTQVDVIIDNVYWEE